MNFYRKKIINKYIETFTVELLNIFDNFKYTTLILDEEKTVELSYLLLEFFDDIFNNTGIWKEYKEYNKKYLENEVFQIKNLSGSNESEFNENDIQFYLWNIYQEIIDGLIISPSHQDLTYLSLNLMKIYKSYEFVNENSFLKDYFGNDNSTGYKIKRKLLWLGTESYLYKIPYKKYLGSKDESYNRISLTDNFVMEYSTIWSGSSPVEIIPNLLNITTDLISDLRTWKNRLFSYYKINSITDNIQEVTNLLNNKNYSIFLDSTDSVFKTNDIVIGSIVKFGLYWYWSGVQSRINKSTDINNEINKFKEQNPKILYSNDENKNFEAKESMKLYTRRALDFFNNDLVEFPDGLTFAVEYQNMVSEPYKKLDPEKLKEIKKKYKLKRDGPNIKLPENITNNENGIIIFLNDIEGMEILVDFNDIKSALLKKGKGLTEDDEDAIFDLISMRTVSPIFTKKIIEKYGHESIYKAFKIKNEEVKIDFLLRKYKGSYFKKRYSNVKKF